MMYPARSPGLRLRAIIPIIAAALKRRPSGRVPDIRVLRFFAGFDQQDTTGRLLTQARGQQRAGRAATDDDDIGIQFALNSRVGHCHSLLRVLAPIAGMSGIATASPRRADLC